MIPLGNERVTLYKRKETTGKDGRTRVSYERHSLNGCSWRQQNAWPQYDTQLQRSQTLTCRIPTGQAIPGTGDYLFLGDVTETFTSQKEIGAALDRYRASGAFRVESVANNAMRGMPMPHYAARG